MKNDFCNVCNKVHKKDFVKFPISKFIDSSGKIVNAKKKYYFCHKSNFFISDSNIIWKKNINKIYKKYSLSPKHFKDSSTRENKIINLLGRSKINLDEILEIGPGNCHLLQNICSLKNVKKIDCFEINNKSLKILKKIDKFRKLYTDLNQIKKKYDLIILSHSLFHIIKLNYNIKKIKNLLKSNGKILIVTPDPLNYPLLPYIYEVYSFSNKRNIINLFQKFNLFLMKDFKYILKNEIVIFLSKKKIKTLKPDNKFLKKHNIIQKKFFLIIKKLKTEKALVIKGAGIIGKFLYLILKNQVFKIYDDYIKVNIKNNQKLVKIKSKKIIKTYDFSLK